MVMIDWGVLQIASALDKSATLFKSNFACAACYVAYAKSCVIIGWAWVAWGRVSDKTYSSCDRL